MAVNLMRLPGFIRKKGRYAEAEPRANQALDILKKSVGTEHPDYGCALDTLAKLYEKRLNRSIVRLSPF
jgi:tetratricopeptide repeat protein